MDRRKAKGISKKYLYTFCLHSLGRSNKNIKKKEEKMWESAAKQI